MIEGTAPESATCVPPTSDILCKRLLLLLVASVVAVSGKERSLRCLTLQPGHLLAAIRHHIEENPLDARTNLSD
jgi:hypothetical protein